MEGLCVDREAEANKGKSSQRRVVTLRSWLVMGKEKIGHMIEKATKYFGWVVLWNGNQRMSLITVDERVTNCSKIIEDETIEGPVNMVSRYIQHKDYMRSVAKKLQRPVWWLKVPSFLLRFFLWEMSELVLGSQKVEPFNQ
jgi:NAD dependent epimerase/dehydratase family enzyme